MVIRISPSSTTETYTLSNSRPCAVCLLKIKNMECFGYKISKVYFSNKNGEIVCYKLQNLIKEKQYISKYYRSTAIPKRLLREFDLNVSEKSPKKSDNEPT